MKKDEREQLILEAYNYYQKVFSLTKAAKVYSNLGSAAALMGKFRRRGLVSSGAIEKAHKGIALAEYYQIFDNEAKRLELKNTKQR